MNIRKARVRHAKLRAMQRVGLNISKGTLEQIARMIQSGRAVFVARQSLSRTIWDVELQGKTIRVVYYKPTKQILTFLPREEKGQGLEPQTL
ncbi:MAG: hypothetical protein WBP42_02500 [Candidatus Zixiibacteriota bacterium]